MKSQVTKKRDIGQEILDGLREFKAHQRGGVELRTRTTEMPAIEMPDPKAARERMGLSQSAFAALIGVSRRTLQEWEQGRRSPTGPARALLRVAERHPEALLN